MTAKMACACEDQVCANLLVRGDRISFVSVEQARRVGCNKKACEQQLNEQKMPSDITLPKGYVLVHDTAGTLFGKCDFYVVKWHDRQQGEGLEEHELAAAQDYFGNAQFQQGSVEIPGGPWKRVCKIEFIRYRRPGYSRGFEHRFESPQWLYSCRKPLAWKLVLPEGRCRVTSHGFESP